MAAILTIVLIVTIILLPEHKMHVIAWLSVHVFAKQVDRVNTHQRKSQQRERSLESGRNEKGCF